MEALQKELVNLEQGASFRQTVESVDKIIEQLEQARNTIAAGV